MYVSAYHCSEIMAHFTQQILCCRKYAENYPSLKKIKVAVVVSSCICDLYDVYGTFFNI